MLFELILFSLIGVLCTAIGYLIWKKQRIQLVHAYHWSNVREEDKPAYTSGIGRATMLLGIGCLLAGALNYISMSWYGWLVFAAFFLVSIVWYVRTQLKYNKYSA